MAEIFVSYSREDRDFVRKIHDAFATLNRDMWVDWEGIPPTSEWMKEILAAIEGADVFLLVISTASCASEICKRELDHAVANNKRLVPILLRPVSASTLPAAVAKIQLLSFAEEDFETAFARLVRAIDTDLDRVKSHTRLLVRAKEWESKAKDASFLLRGNDLKEIEEWLARAGPETEVCLTELQSEYILASQNWQRAEEHRWKELYETAERQRRIAVARHLAAEAAFQLRVVPTACTL